MERREETKSAIPIYSYINPTLNSFFISLFVRAGSMYESEDEWGITHFFEHVAIRNVNGIMSGKLYEILDKHGIEFNAATYNEMVQFYITGAKESFSIAADIISAILSPITLSSTEIDRERDRIRAEIRESDEATSLIGFTLGAVHGDTSLSRIITGSLGSVRKIGQRRLEEFRKRTMTRENVFLYVTGAASDKDIDYLRLSLDKYPISSGNAHTNIAPVPQKFAKRAATVAIKNASFTKVRFTFDLDMERVSVAECDLLYDQLISGYSSDFFMELSERRGLCYDLTGQIERYRNIGSFSFTYELPLSKLYEALGATVEILKKFKTDVLPRDKFMTAQYTDNAMMLYDDARELNFTFAYDNHIMGEGYRDIAARREEYKRVTPERIREVAREVFTRDNLTLTMKAPRKRVSEERIEKILSEL